MLWVHVYVINCFVMWTVQHIGNYNMVNTVIESQNHQHSLWQMNRFSYVRPSASRLLGNRYHREWTSRGRAVSSQFAGNISLEPRECHHSLKGSRLQRWKLVHDHSIRRYSVSWSNVLFDPFKKNCNTKSSTTQTIYGGHDLLYLS